MRHVKGPGALGVLHTKQQALFVTCLHIRALLCGCKPCKAVLRQVLTRSQWLGHVQQMQLPLRTP
jgi:hypothetical protein